MALPDTYSELYPGRFLKSDMLKGKKVTLTIKNINIEDLVGDKNKAEPKVIISFVERPLEYVCPKTNGFCMKRMFGNNPHDWIGKRVTWFGTTCKFGREDVDCLRIWGSPDISEDMPITIPQGRKKALEMTMHRMVPKTNGAAPQEQLDPRILTAFGILEWTPMERQQFLTEQLGVPQEDLLKVLNAKVDTLSQ
jgi:hypothetical protein